MDVFQPSLDWLGSTICEYAPNSLFAGAVTAAGVGSMPLGQCHRLDQFQPRCVSLQIIGWSVGMQIKTLIDSHCDYDPLAQKAQMIYVSETEEVPQEGIDYSKSLCLDSTLQTGLHSQKPTVAARRKAAASEIGPIQARMRSIFRLENRCSHYALHVYDVSFPAWIVPALWSLLFVAYEARSRLLKQHEGTANAIGEHLAVADSQRAGIRGLWFEIRVVALLLISFLGFSYLLAVGSTFAGLQGMIGLSLTATDQSLDLVDIVGIFMGIFGAGTNAVRLAGLQRKQRRLHPNVEDVRVFIWEDVALFARSSSQMITIVVIVCAILYSYRLLLGR